MHSLATAFNVTGNWNMSEVTVKNYVIRLNIE